MSLQDEFRVLLEDIVRKVVREELSHVRPPAGAADQLLSVAEAAELASAAPGTIRAWLKGGKLHRYGCGGRLLRVRRAELLALLAGPGSDENGLSPEALADRHYEKRRRRVRRQVDEP